VASKFGVLTRIMRLACGPRYRTQMRGLHHDDMFLY
jgi:hypothetical protein